jgi:hypothetical protein
MPRRLWMATLAALLGLTSVGLPTLAQGDRPIAVVVSSHANVDLGDVAVGRVRERVITLSLESGEGARWSSFVFDPYGPFDYFHVPVHALPRNTGPHGTDAAPLRAARHRCFLSHADHDLLRHDLGARRNGGRRWMSNSPVEGCWRRRS